MSAQATLQVGDRVRLLRDDRPGVCGAYYRNVGKSATVLHELQNLLPGCYVVECDDGLRDLIEPQTVEVIYD